MTIERLKPNKTNKLNKQIKQKIRRKENFIDKDVRK